MPIQAEYAKIGSPALIPTAKFLVLMCSFLWLSALIAIGVVLLDGDGAEALLLPNNWRAFGGVVLAFVGTYSILAIRDSSIVGTAAGFLIPIFLIGVLVPSEWLLPVQEYAVIRKLDITNEFVEYDEIFNKRAGIVQDLLKNGPQVTSDGGELKFLRFIYSPRLSMLLGRSSGELHDPHENYFNYDLSPQDSGIAAWLIGIRAACECYAFCLLHSFIPLLIFGCYYKNTNKTLVSNEINFDRAVFLIAPFCVGLTPIFGA